MNRRNEDEAPTKFRQQVILLSVLFVLLVAAVTWMVVSHSQKQLIEFKSLKIAEIVARQSAEARSAYADLAVGKLNVDGSSPFTRFPPDGPSGPSGERGEGSEVMGENRERTNDRTGV